MKSGLAIRPPPQFRSFPRQRESRGTRAGAGLLAPRFRGDERGWVQRERMGPWQISIHGDVSRETFRWLPQQWEFRAAHRVARFLKPRLRGDERVWVQHGRRSPWRVWIHGNVSRETLRWLPCQQEPRATGAGARSLDPRFRGDERLGVQRYWIRRWRVSVQGDVSRKTLRSFPRQRESRVTPPGAKASGSPRSRG
jgi:hypothetical protein